METKTERIGRLFVQMHNLGFTPSETSTLLKAERVLHRWAEEECNGTIQRDDNGKPFRRVTWQECPGRVPSQGIPDREAAAYRRIETLMERHPGLWWYHQTDPRGCALYVGRVMDLGDRELSSSYHKGFAVRI